mgnify:CR=1 FL=1
MSVSWIVKSVKINCYVSSVNKDISWRNKVRARPRSRLTCFRHWSVRPIVELLWISYSWILWKSSGSSNIMTLTTLIISNASSPSLAVSTGIKLCLLSSNISSKTQCRISTLELSRHQILFNTHQSLSKRLRILMLTSSQM